MNMFGEKVVVDGEVFNCMNDYYIWCDLRQLEIAGKISDLKRYVKYVLVPTQRDEEGKIVEHEVSYIVDFEYILDGKKIAEDTGSYARGAASQLISIKRKLMLYNFGITVKESSRAKMDLEAYLNSDS